MKHSLRGTLVLASGLAAAMTMTLSAPGHAGSAPVLSWTPATGTATYAYGEIDASGTDPVQTFTLTNSGRAGTSALRVALAGSTAFTITSDTCTGASLGPKKTCTVTVRYAPTTAGQTDSATLTASSNKPGALAGHTLTGSATPVTNVQYTLLSLKFAFESDSVRYCDILINVTGLQPSTEYYFRNTYSSGRINDFASVSDSDGRRPVNFIEPALETWTMQAYADADRLVPVGEPSQTFTSAC